MKKKVDIKLLKDWLKAIPTPEGFTRIQVEGKQKYDDMESKSTSKTGYVELISDTIRIIFNYDLRVTEMSWTFIDGHTYFKNGSYWSSFDRRGIEDSFYVDPIPRETPQQVVDGQIERVKKTLENAKNFIKIPGFNWSIHKDNIEKVKEEIKKHGHTFAPRGMGRAERLKAKPDRYSRPANKETAEFFGFKQLWIDDIDWD